MFYEEDAHPQGEFSAGVGISTGIRFLYTIGSFGLESFIGFAVVPPPTIQIPTQTIDAG